MEQQRALNALEPYIILSKSATSPRAAADLITQATAAPQTYVFTELLQTPNIQALRDAPEYLPYLHLLEIFSWGSYTDYTANQTLPSLNPKQHQKLLLLSLLPLCTSLPTLTYTSLQQALALPTATDQPLESLVTTAIYSNLISAHLDPLHRVVRVTAVAPLRDPAPDSVAALLATIDDWQGKCQDMLRGIEVQIADIRATAQMAGLREHRKNERFEQALGDPDKGDEGDEADGGAGGAGDGKKGGWGGGGKWSGFLGKGGKRAAPMDISAGGSSGGGGGDAMDLDYQAGASGKGAPRAAKRKGAGTK